MTSRRQVLTLALALPGTSLACTCNTLFGRNTVAVVRSHFDWATAVFLALVTNSRFMTWTGPGMPPRQLSNKPMDAFQLTDLIVLEVWKGPHRVSEIVSTDSMTNENICGAYVEPNRRYLFYMRGDPPYQLTYCRRITQFENARADIDVLDQLVMAPNYRLQR